MSGRTGVVPAPQRSEPGEWQVRDVDVLRRLAGRLGDGQRSAKVIFGAYQYEGTNRAAVVDAFRAAVDEVPEFRRAFRLADSGDVFCTEAPPPSTLVEVELAGAPRWLADHVLWALLNTGFDLTQGPSGLGIVVRTASAVFCGLSADHAVVDKIRIDRVFQRFFDTLAGKTPSPTRPRFDRPAGFPPPPSGDRWDPDVLARELEDTVAFLSEGEHLTCLSECLDLGDELRRVGGRYGVSEMTVAAGAYAIALMRGGDRDSATFVMPFHGGLVARGREAGQTSRLVPLTISAPAGPTADFLSGIQTRFGELLLSGESVTSIWAGTQINRARRVPWAFLVWEQVPQPPAGMRPWDPPARFPAVARPGLSLFVTSVGGTTRLVMRAPESPANAEALRRFRDELRGALDRLLAAGD